MKYLLIAPQLGFEANDRIAPGGLSQFCRCVARALASSPSITRLGLWCQGDPPGAEARIVQMAQVHAHSALELDVRVFDGSPARLAAAVAWASIHRTYDRIMYLLVNQARLTVLPWHLPWDVWEIGIDVFQPVSWAKYHALRHARNLLSISRNTTEVAARCNPGLPEGKVVYLCVEPPLFAPEPREDPIASEPYDPARRDQAVLIVGNMNRGMLYKGHQELIAAWSEVMQSCPRAELWIAGEGDGGRPELEAQAAALPSRVAEQIRFLGRLDEDALQQRYRRARVFAMPSKNEGFGLVFVEAARHGLPCIGGKYDSVKEIVVHNETGFLVERQPHEVAVACVRLLTDNELAGRFGEAGRRRYLDNFRFEQFRQRLLRTLDLAVEL